MFCSLHAAVDFFTNTMASGHFLIKSFVALLFDEDFSEVRFMRILPIAGGAILEVPAA